MKQKKLRAKEIIIPISNAEYKFLNKYASRNLLSLPELVRGWIHEVMKNEGYILNEPKLPLVELMRE